MGVRLAGDPPGVRDGVLTVGGAEVASGRLGSGADGAQAVTRSSIAVATVATLVVLMLPGRCAA